MAAYRPDCRRSVRLLGVLTKPPIRILLTFDDGPHPVWTNRVLDVLEAHRVKGLFFCVGAEAQRFPELTQSIIDRGHHIGNHTWTHNPVNCFIHSRAKFEIEKVHRHFLERHDYRIKIFRPPWGIVSPRLEFWLRSQLNYEVLHWDIDSYDYIWPFARRLRPRLDGKRKSAQVILMHDGKFLSPLFSKNHMISSLTFLLDQQGKEFQIIDPGERSKERPESHSAQISR